MEKMDARKEKPPLGDLKPKDDTKIDPKADAKVDPKPKPEPKSNSIKFSMKKVKEKPTRGYKKGSKYDAVLDGFLESGNKLVVVTIEGKEANYVRTQLTKRAEARNLSSKISVSVVNEQCYLELSKQTKL